MARRAPASQGRFYPPSRHRLPFIHPHLGRPPCLPSTSSRPSQSTLGIQPRPRRPFLRSRRHHHYCRRDQRPLWLGEYNGCKALFPANYVEEIVPAPAPASQTLPPAYVLSRSVPPALTEKKGYKPFMTAHKNANAPPPPGAGTNSVGLQHYLGRGRRTSMAKTVTRCVISLFFAWRFLMCCVDGPLCCRWCRFRCGRCYWRWPCQGDILVRDRVFIRDASCYLLILYHIRVERGLFLIRSPCLHCGLCSNNDTKNRRLTLHFLTRRQVYGNEGDFVEDSEQVHCREGFKRARASGGGGGNGYGGCAVSTCLSQR